MSAHTPGPWRLHSNAAGYYGASIAGPNDEPLADVVRGDSLSITSAERARANGVVMNAAPELADALEALFAAMRGTPYARLLGERVVKAEAALRKAGLL